MSWQTYFTTPGVAPPWLLGTIGTLKLRLTGATVDQLTGEPAVGGKSGYAAEVGNPVKCDASALPVIGKDRLLPQGGFESTSSYRQRLKLAFDTWQKFSGNDWGILIQTLIQITGLNGATAPRVRCISNSGAWNWFEAGADTTQPPWHWKSTSSSTAGGWLWDTSAPYGPDCDQQESAMHNANPWWRFWLVLESVGSAAFATQWVTLGTGGQPTLGNLTSGSLGFNNVAPSFWATLRTVLDPFRSAHSSLRWILVTFSSTLVNPANTPDDVHNPDGTWGHGYKIVSGQYQASWIANILPVPGTPPPPTFGAANYVTNNTFGYRISQGQYLPL
jgi:hypothetical protein